MKTRKFTALILSIMMIVTIFSTSIFASPNLDTAEEAVTETATLSGSDGNLYLNYDSLYLGVGETAVLIPDLTANGAEVGEYSWTSSNENVVTVDRNGNVTPVSPGRATITVTGEAIDLYWYGWIFSTSCDVEIALSADIDTGETVNLFDKDADGFYDISTADELYAFAALVNGGNTLINAELMNNITVNSGTMNESSTNARVWTPVGNEEHAYTGIFEGNGYYISGLYFSDADAIWVGLFGRLDGTVQNVGVVNSYFYALTLVGGVVGQMKVGTVQNCYNGSTVIATGNIDKVASCGGIVGQSYNYDVVNIINCYNYGEVVNLDSDGKAGGIIGYVRIGRDFTVTNCYNSGTVSGNKDVGAIVGFVDSNTLKAYNCYYLAGTASKAFGRGDLASDSTLTEKEAEAFLSGEVAYLLGSAWGQDLSKENSLPVLNGTKVYKYTDGYSNELKFGFADCTADGVKLNVPNAGTYSLVFADYDGKKLNNIDIVPVTVTADEVGEITRISENDITAGTGDKIMLLQDMIKFIPLCKEYVVK